jgi:hypothetical protein
MRNSPIPRPTTMLTTTKIVMKTQGIQMRKRAGGSASRTKTKTRRARMKTPDALSSSR